MQGVRLHQQSLGRILQEQILLPDSVPVSWSCGPDQEVAEGHGQECRY